VTLFPVSPDDHEFPGADFLDLCRCAFFHSTSRAGAS
jgi:hypothetical protein